MNAPTDSSSNKGAAATTDLRLAEVIGAFSLATDLGIGQPLEYALCSCILSVRIGEALNLNDEQLREVYYQALLRYIGCTAETHILSSLTGDEIATRAAFGTVDNGNPAQIVNWLVKSIRQGNAGSGTLQMAQQIARGILTLPKLKNSFNDHCEVAQRLAERLGFQGPIRQALGQLYERWDGKGSPRGLKGENVALSVRVVTLAQDAVVFSRLEGVDAAVEVAKGRSGSAYDPRISECFCAQANTLMLGLDDEPYWDSVLALEPGQRIFLTEGQFDDACRAFADFIDIKSPYTLNHSTQVAKLAGEASKNYGLPPAETTSIERAALVHDLGKVGIGSGIWDKPSPLSPREWEKVRLHPYYTERILDHPESLSRLGKLAGMHHERLDNSGYHRGASAAMQPPAHRILAAASAYQAMLEPRAHRPALQPDQAANELRKDIRAGKLDSDATNCVLEAAGHHITTRRETVAGLSKRQVEVLRLLARGNSMKEIAAALDVSPKTVDNHIQHIYNKIGVSTRAGATLFAMEQNLLAI